MAVCVNFSAFTHLLGFYPYSLYQLWQPQQEGLSPQRRLYLLARLG